MSGIDRRLLSPVIAKTPTAPVRLINVLGKPDFQQTYTTFPETSDPYNQVVDIETYYEPKVNLVNQGYVKGRCDTKLSHVATQDKLLISLTKKRPNRKQKQEAVSEMSDPIHGHVPRPLVPYNSGIQSTVTNVRENVIANRACVDRTFKSGPVRDLSLYDHQSVIPGIAQRVPRLDRPRAARIGRVQTSLAHQKTPVANFNMQTTGRWEAKGILEATNHFGKPVIPDIHVAKTSRISANKDIGIGFKESIEIGNGQDIASKRDGKFDQFKTKILNVKPVSQETSPYILNENDSNTETIRSGAIHQKNNDDAANNRIPHNDQGKIKIAQEKLAKMLIETDHSYDFNGCISEGSTNFAAPKERELMLDDKPVSTDIAYGYEESLSEKSLSPDPYINKAENKESLTGSAGQSDIHETAESVMLGESLHDKAFQHRKYTCDQGKLLNCKQLRESMRGDESISVDEVHSYVSKAPISKSTELFSDLIKKPAVCTTTQEPVKQLHVSSNESIKKECFEPLDNGKILQHSKEHASPETKVNGWVLTNETNITSESYESEAERKIETLQGCGSLKDIITTAERRTNNVRSLIDTREHNNNIIPYGSSSAGNTREKAPSKELSIRKGNIVNASPDSVKRKSRKRKRYREKQSEKYFTTKDSPNVTTQHSSNNSRNKDNCIKCNTTGGANEADADIDKGPGDIRDKNSNIRLGSEIKNGIVKSEIPKCAVNDSRYRKVTTDPCNNETLGKTIESGQQSNRINICAPQGHVEVNDKSSDPSKSKDNHASLYEEGFYSLKDNLTPDEVVNDGKEATFKRALNKIKKESILKSSKEKNKDCFRQDNGPKCPVKRTHIERRKRNNKEVVTRNEYDTIEQLYQQVDNHKMDQRNAHIKHKSNKQDVHYKGRCGPADQLEQTPECITGALANPRMKKKKVKHKGSDYDSSMTVSKCGDENLVPKTNNGDHKSVRKTPSRLKATKESYRNIEHQNKCNSADRINKDNQRKSDERHNKSSPNEDNRIVADSKTMNGVTKPRKHRVTNRYHMDSVDNVQLKRIERSNKNICSEKDYRSKPSYTSSLDSIDRHTLPPSSQPSGESIYSELSDKDEAKDGHRTELQRSSPASPTPPTPYRSGAYLRIMNIMERRLGPEGVADLMGNSTVTGMVDSLDKNKLKYGLQYNGLVKLREENPNIDATKYITDPTLVHDDSAVSSQEHIRVSNESIDTVPDSDEISNDTSSSPCVSSEYVKANTKHMKKKLRDVTRETKDISNSGHLRCTGLRKERRDNGSRDQCLIGIDIQQSNATLKKLDRIKSFFRSFFVDS